MYITSSYVIVFEWILIISYEHNAQVFPPTLYTHDSRHKSLKIKGNQHIQEQKKFFLKQPAIFGLQKKDGNEIGPCTP